MNAPGLRERKKEATRQALHDAAVRLAVAAGPDRVTVEAIADAANVSRRTFSNYFASKEEALFYGDQRRTGLLLDLVRNRPAHETPWTALTRAADDMAAGRAQDPGWAAEIQLLRRHPSLAGHLVATYATAERELAGEIARRLRQPPGANRTPDPGTPGAARTPDPGTPGAAGGRGTGTGGGAMDADIALHARLLAATFLAVVRVATQHWLDEPRESLRDVLHRALDLAGRSFG